MPQSGAETSVTFDNFLLEAKGKLVTNYANYAVLINQMRKQGLTDQNYDGSSVRFPIIRNFKQGTGPVSETGTLNAPRPIRSTKANVIIATITHAVQTSRRLKQVSGNPATSWAEGVALEVSKAEEAMPRVLNWMLNGDGTGLLYAITSTTAASGGATQDIAVAFASGTASAATGNGSIIQTGMVFDILVRSGLTTVMLGVEVQSTNETTGVITVKKADNTATSFGTDNTMGIYIEGSQAGAANIVQGIQAAAAVTGTFEGIDKAANQDWQGINGRPGDTSSADLSIPIMDGLVRRRGRFGTPKNGLWVADEGVLDKFSQTLLTQSQWAGDKGTLDVGIQYMNYKGERLFPDYDAKRNRIVSVPLDDVIMFEAQPGPDWDAETGSKQQRFSRALPTEMWLVDDRQVGYMRCNRFVFADNLNEAQ